MNTYNVLHFVYKNLSITKSSVRQMLDGAQRYALWHPRGFLRQETAGSGCALVSTYAIIVVLILDACICSYRTLCGRDQRKRCTLNYTLHWQTVLYCLQRECFIV